jgi:hypothetical protein
MTENADDQGAKMRELVAQIDAAQAAHPTRLAKARAAADAARAQALAAEPWDELWAAVPGYDSQGGFAGMLTLPSVDAKELFGARLAYDLLGCAADPTGVRQILTAYYAMIPDPDHLSLVALAALKVIATQVIPKMLEVIEHQAGNWDLSVVLADAEANAWSTRVNDTRG